MQNKEIIFLTKEQILTIHEEQITLNGGVKGVRDENLLLSSIGEPKQTFDGKYLYPTIYEMAAVYLYSFAKNHSFFDGNKRVALMACAVFLYLNNYDLIFNNNEFEDIILKCVENKLNKSEIAKLIENNAIDWNKID